MWKKYLEDLDLVLCPFLLLGSRMTAGQALGETELSMKTVSQHKVVDQYM